MPARSSGIAAGAWSVSLPKVDDGGAQIALARLGKTGARPADRGRPAALPAPRPGRCDQLSWALSPRWTAWDPAGPQRTGGDFRELYP